MWSSRHRWPVAAAWFVGTIAVFVLSALTGGIRAEDANGSPNQAQTESAKAYAIFDQGGTGTPTEDVLLVVTHPQLKVTDPAFASFVASTIATSRAHATVNGQTVPVFDSSRTRRPPPQARAVAPTCRVRIVATMTGDQTPSRAPRPRPAGDRGDRGGRGRQGLRCPHPEPTLTNEDITTSSTAAWTRRSPRSGHPCHVHVRRGDRAARPDWRCWRRWTSGCSARPSPRSARTRPADHLIGLAV
jgi:hypothetical protein